MTAFDIPRRDRPFLIRHGVGVLTVGMALFVLQTGIIPFDFSTQLIDGEVRDFFIAGGTSSILSDVVSNIFLYLPLGALLYWSFRRRLRHWFPTVLVAVLIAAILSAVIEWSQAYSPSRVSSLVDLTANTLGAALGACVGLVTWWILPRFLETALVEFADRPMAAVVVTYVGLLIFVAAMPFSLSLDPGLFNKSLKSSYWTPFASVHVTVVADAEGTTGEPSKAYAYAKWRSMKRWSRWAAETASFVLLVWLLLPLLRTHYEFKPGGALFMVAWLCILLAVGQSLLQLFSVTRDFDMTDIVFRLTGLLFGLATGGRVMRWQLRARTTSLGSARVFLKAGCALALGYILYTGVLPLTFSPQTTGLRQSLNEQAFWPFVGYFVTRFDVMMDDAMEKVFAYALFGALLVVSLPRLRKVPLGGRMVRLAAVGIVVAVPIEIVQAYIPVRITSLTDPILAACGMSGGVLALSYAARFYGLSRSLQSVKPLTRESEHQPSTTSALDDLLGTLLEPMENAPAEPGILNPSVDSRSPSN